MSNIDELRAAAQAVLDRWDSPQWEWTKHGPTADLMHALRAALAQPAETDAELERRTGEPHIDGYPLFSGLPPPAQPAASGEPVAHVGDLIIQVRERVAAQGILNTAPLYTAQPAPARVPMSDEMMKQCRAECDDDYTKRGIFISGWIGAERAHGITAPGGA